MSRVFAILLSLFLFITPSLAQGGIVIVPNNAGSVLLYGIHGPGRAQSVQFAPNGKLLAVATTAGVNLYETAEFGEGDPFDGDPYHVQDIAFSPDGGTLVSVGVGYNVRAYDVLTGELIESVYPENLADSLGQVAISPDSQTVVLSAGDSIHVFDTVSSEMIATAAIHDHRITDMAFSPDGSLFATASGDSTVKLWDAATNDEIRTLVGHDEAVNNVSFSPDGAFIVTASEDGTVRIWDVNDGTSVQLEAISGARLISAAFGASGGMVASGSIVAAGGMDGMVHLFDPDTGAELVVFGPHLEPVESLSISPDGQWLASLSAGEVKLWDLINVAESGSVRFEPSFTALAVSPDGRWLAAGGSDGITYVYEEATGALMHSFPSASPPVTSLVFGLDSTTLYVGSTASTVNIYNVETGETVGEYETTASVIELTSHPTIPMINGAMVDGALRWWNTDTGGINGTAYAHPAAPVSATEFSPDGRYMASADAGGEVFLWSVEQGDFLYTLDGGHAEVLDLAFSLDGSRLAAGMSGAQLAVWDTGASSQPLFTFNDFAGDVVGVAFNTTGDMVAVATGYGTVEFITADDGTELAREYLTMPVNALAFSPDGTRLYSVGDDGLLHVWGVVP